MGQNGGARPGSGRKRIEDKFAGTIARAHTRIAKSLPEYLDNMETLARGVLVMEANPITGEPAVYQKPPDFKANQDLINRILGKPTERREVQTQDVTPERSPKETLESKLARLEPGPEENVP